MNTSVISKMDTKKKVDIIFSYLFSDEKSNEEEFFWNNLKKEEISRLEEIDKNDETFDFRDLKSEILWK